MSVYVGIDVQLRALLRHRASLVRLGTQLRNRIHAVAADHG
jgi:hypothetical protein